MDDILDNKWVRGCFGVTGFTFAGGAVTALIMLWIVGSGGGRLELAGTVGAVACLACSFLLGAVLCVFGVRGLLAEQTVGRRAEEEMLEVARSRGGTVTVAQVAEGTRLTLEESRAVLDDLARQGLIRMTVDDEGTERYRFSGMDELAEGESRSSFERTLREARKRVGQIDDESERTDREEAELEVPHDSS